MKVVRDISTVEGILVDLKSHRVLCNKRDSVIFGGVVADSGGLACATYHCNTPYVKVCTCNLSGTDTGLRKRTHCDSLGCKIVFGAYRIPILTLTDRGFS